MMTCGPSEISGLPVSLDRVGGHVLAAQLERGLARGVALDEGRRPGHLDVVAARDIVHAQHDPWVASEVAGLDRRRRRADPEDLAGPQEPVRASAAAGRPAGSWRRSRWGSWPGTPPGARGSGGSCAEDTVGGEGAVKKLINDPSAFVDEMLDGILLAHPGPAPGGQRGPPLDRPGGRADRRPRRHRHRRRVRPPAGLPRLRGRWACARGVRRRQRLLVAVDGPDPRGDARRSTAARASCTCYGNYGGDVLNFDLAGELADAEGITRRDGARSPTTSPRRRPSGPTSRRGVAGHVLRVQVRGRGGRRRRDARRRSRRRPGRRSTDTRSMGVGLSPTILPGRRQADLRAGRRRDGDRHRHPRRARRPARPARDRRRGRRRPARRDRDRPRAARAATAWRSSSTASARRPLEELYILYRRVHAGLDGARRARSTGRTSASSRRASRWPARRSP